MSFRIPLLQKRFGAFFILVAGLAGATACGLKIGEKAPIDKPVVIGGSGFSCLSRITEYMDNFLAAKLEDNEIRRFSGCVKYALESFSRHTRGREKNIYQPKEIRDFLHEYFIKDKEISDNLLQEFMVLKQTIVGGSTETVSRGDLNQAIYFLNFLEEQALKLNPYMHVYNFKVGRLKISKKDVEPEVMRAVHVLNGVGMAMGQRLALAKTSYSMEHLQSFLSEFRNFIGWSKEFPNARPAEIWSNFISAYKSVVAASEGDIIRPKDWSHMLTTATGVYGISLKVRYVRERRSLLYGEGLDGVIRVADDVVRLLQSAVDQQPKNVITYVQLDRLVDSLEPLGLMPRVPSADASGGRAIKAQSFKKILRAFFDKILGDATVPWRQRRGEGLTRAVIRHGADEFSRWAEVQRFLDQTFQQKDKTGESDRVETLSERLGPAGASGQLLKILRDGTNSQDKVSSLVRLMEQSLRPLFRPGEDQIFLTESGQMAKYQLVHGFHNLSMMNLSRAIVSLVGRGYSTYRGKGEGPFDGGITDDEMQAFYMDFRDFGVDLQLFDPRSTNAGYRSFQEANMFTYTGNGLQRPSLVKDPKEAMMTHPEGIEYVMFIMSGGAMGQAIYSGMMGEKGLCREASQNAPISVHQYKMIERKCFAKNLMPILLPRLTTMPTMQAELERAGEAEKAAVVEDLMAAVYTQGSSDPQYIEWHELNTIAMIMHYTESVMTRYNMNQDTYLDSAEVWQAYETFAVYMQTMARDKCVKMMKSWSNSNEPPPRSLYGGSEFVERLKQTIAAHGCDKIPNVVSEVIFAYLVANGKLPESLADLGDINYLPRAPWVGQEFKVDRASLLRVFAALVKASGESAKKNNLQ